MADPDGGFRILEGSTLEAIKPKDTAAVQKAKAEHEKLFKMIALRNQIAPTAPPASPPAASPLEAAEPPVSVPVNSQPQETRAVQQRRRQHSQLFNRIAEQHRQVAEEHRRIAAIREAAAASTPNQNQRRSRQRRPSSSFVPLASRS